MPPPTEDEPEITCSNCGLVIAMRANFCPKCGHALPSLRSVALDKGWMSRGSAR